MKLRDWRKEKGWTQAVLAQELNTRPSTISQYETFKRKPLKLEMMERIFALTDGAVTPNDLCGISKEEKKKTFTVNIPKDNDQILLVYK